MTSQHVASQHLILIIQWEASTWQPMMVNPRHVNSQWETWTWHPKAAPLKLPMRSQYVGFQERDFPIANEKPVRGISTKQLSNNQWEASMLHPKTPSFSTANEKSARGFSTPILNNRWSKHVVSLHTILSSQWKASTWLKNAPFLQSMRSQPCYLKTQFSTANEKPARGISTPNSQ